MITVFVTTPSGLSDGFSMGDKENAREVAEELGFEVISTEIFSILTKTLAVVVTEESFDSVQERKAGCYR